MVLAQVGTLRSTRLGKPSYNEPIIQNLPMEESKWKTPGLLNKLKY